MDWPVSFVVLVVLAIVVEGFRAVSRRQFVEQWAHEHNLTIESCRYAFLPFSPNWLVTYRVRLVDSGGRQLEGTAYATGFFRKRAWVDFKGSGRGSR